MVINWRKSTRSTSNGGDCVEVGLTPGQVYVRDSKDKGGPVLAVSPAEWRSFLASFVR